VAQAHSVEKYQINFSAVDRILSHYSRESLSYYLQHIVIASEPDPQPFGKCAEWWQRAILKPKIPAFEFLAGLPQACDYWRDGREWNNPLSFMTILPRGHDKSSLEARLASWAITASRKFCPAYIVAADLDQGKLILQAMEAEARLNPWLYDQLKFTRKVVYGPSGFVEVLPADSASAYGLRGRLYIFDEWTHWKNETMSTAVLSGSEKIPGSLTVILSNAGLLRSWQHDFYTKIQHDPDLKSDWVLFEREGKLASWMSEQRIRAKAKLLPPGEAKRLYGNKWIDPATENDYLFRHEVEVCESLGASMGLLYRLIREPGVTNYIAAIDYGARKDRTVLVIGHYMRDGTFVVDRMEVWQGTPNNPVKITRVNEWIAEVRKSFQPRVWVVDPSQMEGTIQGMEAQGLNVRRFTGRGGADNAQMATHLRSLIVTQRLAWYRGAGNLRVKDVAQREYVETFTDELCGLVVKRMNYGWRFDHERNAHDDRSVGVGMAAIGGLDFMS